MTQQPITAADIWAWRKDDYLALLRGDIDREEYQRRVADVNALEVQAKRGAA